MRQASSGDGGITAMATDWLVFRFTGASSSFLPFMILERAVITPVYVSTWCLSSIITCRAPEHVLEDED
ncbi:MAG: hypothetical protein ACXAEU_08750 [Candidatus Hodarchaeales archaeon]